MRNSLVKKIIVYIIVFSMTFINLFSDVHYIYLRSSYFNTSLPDIEVIITNPDNEQHTYTTNQDGIITLEYNSPNTDETALKPLKSANYPNPFSSVTTFDISKNIKSVSIYNIKGQKISQLDKLKDNSEIRLHNLSSGIYFARFDSKDNTSYIKKFVYLHQGNSKNSPAIYLKQLEQYSTKSTQNEWLYEILNQAFLFDKSGSFYFIPDQTTEIVLDEKGYINASFTFPNGNLINQNLEGTIANRDFQTQNGLISNIESSYGEKEITITTEFLELINPEPVIVETDSVFFNRIINRKQGLPTTPITIQKVRGDTLYINLADYITNPNSQADSVYIDFPDTEGFIINTDSLNIEIIPPADFYGTVESMVHLIEKTSGSRDSVLVSKSWLNAFYTEINASNPDSSAYSGPMIINQLTYQYSNPIVIRSLAGNSLSISNANNLYSFNHTFIPDSDGVVNIITFHNISPNNTQISGIEDNIIQKSLEDLIFTPYTEIVNSVNIFNNSDHYQAVYNDSGNVLTITPSLDFHGVTSLEGIISTTNGTQIYFDKPVYFAEQIDYRGWLLDLHRFNGETRSVKGFIKIGNDIYHTDDTGYFDFQRNPSNNISQWRIVSVDSTGVVNSFVTKYNMPPALTDLDSLGALVLTYDRIIYGHGVEEQFGVTPQEYLTFLSATEYNGNIGFVDWFRSGNPIDETNQEFFYGTKILIDKSYWATVTNNPDYYVTDVQQQLIVNNLILPVYLPYLNPNHEPLEIIFATEDGPHTRNEDGVAIRGYVGADKRTQGSPQWGSLYDNLGNFVRAAMSVNPHDTYTPEFCSIYVRGPPDGDAIFFGKSVHVEGNMTPGTIPGPIDVKTYDLVQYFYKSNNNPNRISHIYEGWKLYDENNEIVKNVNIILFPSSTIAQLFEIYIPE